MVAKKYNDPLDSTAFVLGLLTLLKQYHSECTEMFITILGQYVRSTVDANVNKYVRQTWILLLDIPCG